MSRPTAAEVLASLASPSLFSRPDGDWIYNHLALLFSFPVPLMLSTRGYENQLRVNVIIKQT